MAPAIIGPVSAAEEFEMRDALTDFGKVTKTLQGSVPPKDCGQPIPPISFSDGAAVGARKVLDSFFGQCGASKTYIKTRASIPFSWKQTVAKRPRLGSWRSINDRHLPEELRDQYVRTHYLLDDLLKQKKKGLYPAGPACAPFDATVKPPIYGFGAKPSYTRGRIVLTGDRNRRSDGAEDGVLEGRGTAVSAIDCSGLVDAAFAASGLKFATNQDLPPGYGTAQLARADRLPNSCVERAKLVFPQGLRAGDVVNLSESHVIVIDGVGRDPFGLQRLGDKPDCSKVNPAHFDFTYINSASFHDYGPSRVHAAFAHEEGGTAGPKIMANLEKAARRMCRLQNGEPPQQGDAEDSAFKILRHMSAKAECVGKPMKLETEECLKGCNHRFGYPDGRSDSHQGSAT